MKHRMLLTSKESIGQALVARTIAGTIRHMAKKKSKFKFPDDPPGRKGKVFEVHLSVTERDEFRLAAARAGLSLSEWMRVRLIEAAKEEAKRD
jgi:hypothetical protein